MIFIYNVPCTEKSHCIPFSFSTSSTFCGFEDKLFQRFKMFFTYLLTVSLYLLATNSMHTVYGNYNSLESRNLQVNPTPYYRATYKADFQHLKDPLCQNDLETNVYIWCSIGSNLTIIDQSDTRINCTALTDTNYTCTMDCINEGCEDLYVATNASSFFDDPFASITFMCEHEDPNFVYGRMEYKGNDVTCFSDNTTVAKSRTFHAARLGVSCPIGSSQEFVYDDTYFECYGHPPVNTGVNGNDIYTCVSGVDCGGFGCSSIIEDIIVYSTVYYFYNECVEKMNDKLRTFYPTPAPAISSFAYTARFEALWSVMYDFDSLTESNCINPQQGVAIRCTNGASIIYLESSEASMKCMNVSISELNCISSDESVQNSFVRVDYACTGPKVPSSDVTFLQSSTACTFVQNPFNISHAVAMGINCGVFTFYYDTLVECANANHQFFAGSMGFDVFGNDFYMCSESVLYDIISTTEQTISNVTIRTDDVWLEFQIEQCIAFGPAPTPTPTSVPVLSEAPTSKPQTSSPTSAPSIKPIASSTSAPITSRGIPTNEAPIEIVDNNSNVESGVIIGGVVGGIAVIVIIALLAYKLNQPKNTTSIIPPKETVPGTDTSPPNQLAAIQNILPTPLPVPPPQSVTTGTTDLPSQSNAVATVQSISSQSTNGRAASTGGYMPDYKDQSRSVVQPLHTSTTSSGNASLSTIQQVVATDLDHREVMATTPNIADHIPIAVAYGVSTTSADSGLTSRSKRSQEPPGRIVEDP